MLRNCAHQPQQPDVRLVQVGDHADESQLVVNLRASVSCRRREGAAETALAAEMHAAWIRFAAAGDPGWRPFDASYPVMTFGATPGHATVLDSRGDERASWPEG